MVAARELFFHPLARRDFLEARGYYARHDSDELADSFHDAVNDAADRIARFGKLEHSTRSHCQLLTERIAIVEFGAFRTYPAFLTSRVRPKSAC